jgi:hypothetical protein
MRQGQEKSQLQLAREELSVLMLSVCLFPVLALVTGCAVSGDWGGTAARLSRQRPLVLFRQPALSSVLHIFNNITAYILSLTLPLVSLEPMAARLAVEHNFNQAIAPDLC